MLRTILFDEEFQFSDGETGEKLLICLNDGSCGFYIIVKVTSQSTYKGTRFGCQNNDRYPNFFLPEGSCYFKEATWVGLDEYFEFDSCRPAAKTFSR